MIAIADQQRFIAALNACPNGVIRMSDDIEGVVETSLNVGVISTQEKTIKILCLVRSLIDSGRSQVESMLSSIAELANANIEFSGAYPGWKHRSRFRNHVNLSRDVSRHIRSQAKYYGNTRGLRVWVIQKALP